MTLGLVVAYMASQLLLPAIRHQARGSAQADLHRLALLALGELRRDLASSGFGGVTVYPDRIAIQPQGDVTPDGRLCWDATLIVYALNDGRLTRRVFELPNETLLDRPVTVEPSWLGEPGGEVVVAGVRELEVALVNSTVEMAIDVGSDSLPDLPSYRAQESFTLRGGTP